VSTLLALALLLQEPGRTATVTCKDAPEHSYVYYLPRAYTPEKRRPILYCFSPNADGASFAKLYRDACEEAGWILAASNNAQNGPWPPIEAAMRAMWKDTHERFAIDDRRVFTTGWSGGGRMALLFSMLYPVAGAAPIGGGAATDIDRATKATAVFLVRGDRDTGAQEEQAGLEKRMREEGFRFALKRFAGEHELPSKKVARECIRWLSAEKPQPDPEAAARALVEGTRALEEVNYKVATPALITAFRKGEAEVARDARTYLSKIEAVAEQIWTEAEAARGAKRRELLARLRSEFEGLEIAVRAAEALK
jgi:dienelactone hydrolase